jgi:general secretion pathway protein N
MRRALVLVAVVVAFAIVVVVIAPASLASLAVERASHGMLTLAEAEGTLWSGRGTLAAPRSFRLPLAWSIDPWAFARGELRVHVLPSPAAGATPRAEIAARRDTLALRDVDVTLPAEVVEGLAPRSGIRINGDVHLTTPSLDWTPTAFSGGARIDWQDAQFAISVDPGIRLGAVGVALAAAGDRLTGPLTNVGGAYDVNGTLSLAATGAPDVVVTMTPREGKAEDARTLRVTADPDGNWNVQFRAGPP